MNDPMAAPRAEDLLSVGTRIRWGAILAGAMLALALYFLLTILGGAGGAGAPEGHPGVGDARHLVRVRGHVDFDAGRGRGRPGRGRADLPRAGRDATQARGSGLKESGRGA